MFSHSVLNRSEGWEQVKSKIKLTVMKNINYSSRAQDSNLHSPNSKSGWLPITTALVKNTKIQNNDSLKRDICDSGGIRTHEPEREQFYRLPALTTCIHYQLLSILCADERNQTSTCCFGDNHSLTKLHLQITHPCGRGGTRTPKPIRPLFSRQLQYHSATLPFPKTIS